MPSVLQALRISLATFAGSSFLPVFWPVSNFCCKYPRTLSEKCVCPLSAFRFVKCPTHSERVYFGCGFNLNFCLEARLSFGIQWNNLERWLQSIRNWSYTPLCTIFTGLWFAVTLWWASSSSRLGNSFKHWGWGHSKVPLTSSTLLWCVVVLSISRAEIAKNGFTSLRLVASCGQNMMSFHAIG